MAKGQPNSSPYIENQSMVEVRITINKMISKDANPNNIKMKDERFSDRMWLLGTEGTASLQDGRKPGGVVNGSVELMK